MSVEPFSQCSMNLFCSRILIFLAQLFHKILYNTLNFSQKKLGLENSWKRRGIKIQMRFHKEFDLIGHL